MPSPTATAPFVPRRPVGRHPHRRSSACSPRRSEAAEADVAVAGRLRHELVRRATKCATSSTLLTSGAVPAAAHRRRVRVRDRRDPSLVVADVDVGRDRSVAARPCAKARKRHDRLVLRAASRSAASARSPQCPWCADATGRSPRQAKPFQRIRLVRAAEPRHVRREVGVRAPRASSAPVGISR